MNIRDRRFFNVIISILLLAGFLFLILPINHNFYFKNFNRPNIHRNTGDISSGFSPFVVIPSESSGAFLSSCLNGRISPNGQRLSLTFLKKSGFTGSSLLIISGDGNRTNFSNMILKLWRPITFYENDEEEASAFASLYLVSA